MYQGFGTVVKGVGGLFTVRLFPANSPQMPQLEQSPQPLDGASVFARARGILRKKGALLVGDRVRVTYDDSSFHRAEDDSVIPSPDGTGIAVEEILSRRCALIRPPMANLDVLFVTAAATAPEPEPETLDKLICIAEFNHIEPILIITKHDRDEQAACRLAGIYRLAGFPVYCVTGLTGEGTDELKNLIHSHLNNKIAAFSGASGVGKSTLLNCLFPELQLETGDISQRIGRGKNTTRSVELYPISSSPESGYLADTPGFTMLDFERFDFFEKDDLAGTFREFAPYIGSCRYKKCTHTKEEGCAILEAIANGQIAPSRHKSYVGLYQILKEKHRWEK